MKRTNDRNKDRTAKKKRTTNIAIEQKCERFVRNTIRTNIESIYTEIQR